MRNGFVSAVLSGPGKCTWHSEEVEDTHMPTTLRLKEGATYTVEDSGKITGMMLALLAHISPIGGHPGEDVYEYEMPYNADTVLRVRIKYDEDDAHNILSGQVVGYFFRGK